MNKKPLVSCIIIFFNTVEQFFIEAIESVFAQTYDRWELVLADDGSKKECTAIALRYAQQYPEKVHYVEHEGHQNRGMSATRNLGSHNAKGEYIAFLDSDDIWLPQKLEKQVAILEDQPEVAMVFGHTEYWYSWTGNPEDIQYDHLAKLDVKPNTLVKPPKMLTLLLQAKIYSPGNCSVLMRRKVIEDVGEFEESFRDLFEDQVFYAKVWLKAPVFVEDVCWARYRQHPSNCCNTAKSKGINHTTPPNPAELAFLTWLEKYMYAEAIKDTELWQALNTRLLPYNYPTLYYLLKGTRYIKSRVRGFVKSINSKAD